MEQHPYIENAPGLRWRWRNMQWEAIWRARPDLVRRGFLPKNRLLWKGKELSETVQARLQDECQALQGEMLVFSRGGLPEVSSFTGTLGSLIHCYMTDPESTFHTQRYGSRRRTENNVRRIIDKHGDTKLSEINGRLVKAWHREWSGDGTKLPMGHSFVGHLRTIFGFGFTLLEDKDCERLCAVMHKLRFPSAIPNEIFLSANQADLIRAEAHKSGYPSIALAQAIQFESAARQKDIIGEWVPMGEPGTSEVTHPHKHKKWLRGMRWSEIDENLIWRHSTSKKGKPIIADLKISPMAMEELAKFAKVPIATVTRSVLPASGPVIICDYSGVPWLAGEFTRNWRRLARSVGIPDEVCNRHSRHGAITEADSAGAELDHVRKMATHSNISQTQRYSKQSQEHVAEAQRKRVAHRNKMKTDVA